MRPIVFITGRGDMSTAVEGMRAGAVSFLPKPVSRGALVAALREALSKDASTRVVHAERQRVRDLLDSLTPRERQVLELVARGLLNKQIAGELGTAEKTIKVHRGRLMHKMQVKSAAALVQLLSHGELPQSPAVEHAGHRGRDVRLIRHRAPSARHYRESAAFRWPRHCGESMPTLACGLPMYRRLTDANSPH